MEYAEVCFILSEVNGWDQDYYKKGVRASMERWGVDAAVIDNFVATLPAATEENVMMQKYISLYMQLYEAWSEYRRTGYPNTLIKPNETYTYTWPVINSFGSVEQVSQTFTFKVTDFTDVPNRVNYLLNEASINGDNVNAASSSIGGDKMETKMWWQE